ncbi:putative RNA/RNP complex-1-interacting phosphatase [Senna tora]|uniref:Putative RNA/RNP complex-1-interacting phosphatase n=1 Tax=Senna tora TaxID=362788 RepID=A0A834X0Y8_9FABA|nr:putative RNA/RNP complex-1-interacting phosphatase [Senna tora]
MAALSVGHYWHTKRGPTNELTNRRSPKMVILLSCHGRGPMDNSDSEGKNKEMMMMTGGKLGFLRLMMNRFEKMGKKVKKNLSPQQKGDWKDLVLMSLSFAVYVYISQKIVCAYYAWSFMPKHPW